MRFKAKFYTTGDPDPLEIEWVDGEIRGSMEAVSVVTTVLDYWRQANRSVALTPTGPFFYGDELTDEPFGFIAFMDKAFPDPEIEWSGEMPKLAQKHEEGVVY